jgi:hypothetical protein
MVTKEDIENRLTSHDRYKIFESLGVDLPRKQATADGWVNGLRRPQALGHDENASFSVNVETGAVKDFGGPYSNDLYGLVMDVLRCSFPEALDWIAEKIGMRPEVLPPKTALAAVPVADALAWSTDLVGTQTGAAAALFDYLTEERGLRVETVKNRQLGQRRYEGRWWLFIPVATEGDEVTCFKMIAFDPERRGWLLNARGKKIIQARGSGLFLYDCPIDRSRPLMLCEGEMDALVARQSGHNAISATAGAGTFKDEWVELAAAHPAAKNGIVIAYDGDGDGRKGARKVAGKLSGKGLDVRIAMLPDDTDVSDLLRREGGASVLQQLIDDSLPFAAATSPTSEAPDDVLRASAQPGPAGDGSPFSSVFTVADLMREKLREPQWIVEGIFPEGVMLLSGKPKVGKTFWALNVAHAVACGGYAFGSVRVEKGRVLYLDLEGTRRNLQKRFERLLGEDPPPDNLHIVKQWPTGQEGQERLTLLLEKYPDTRLVVVDTLKAIRGYGGGRSKTAYDVDYEAVAPFARIAEDYGSNLLLNHHNNKKDNPEDPFDAISGSTGLRGAVTTEAVLLKDPPTGHLRLLARGRDLEEVDCLFDFDRSRLTWNLVGDTALAQVNAERQMVADVLREANPERMRPKEVHEVLAARGYKRTESNVRHLLRKMARETGSLVVGDGTQGYGLTLPLKE